jgi:hypothetical protein
VQDERGPGVIDFQDALRGPIGYDLVSLLKDCYISWSRERVERWVKGYRRVLGSLGANVGDSEYQFVRWFDMIGVQRHVKVLGIFCRLWYRDGKPGYLGDLPLVFEYVRDACKRYPELVEFERWLAWRVAPIFGAALEREKARASRPAPVPVRRRAAAKKVAEKKKTAVRKRLKPRVPRKKRVVKRTRAVRTRLVKKTRVVKKARPVKRPETKSKGARSRAARSRAARSRATKSRIANKAARLKRNTRVVTRARKPKRTTRRVSGAPRKRVIKRRTRTARKPK